MGLLDVAEGVGGAIVDGASTIASAGASAVTFAKGIADKAEGFVEEKIGAVASGLAGAAGKLIEGPLGAIPAVVGAIGGAMADPLGFARSMAAKAENTAISAIAFAEGIVKNIAQSTLNVVRKVQTVAQQAIDGVLRGVLGAVAFGAKAVITNLGHALKQLRLKALSLIPHDGPIALNIRAAKAKAGLVILRALRPKIFLLTSMATAAVTNMALKAINRAREKAISIAATVHRKASFVVLKALPQVIKVTGKVMTLTRKLSIEFHGKVVAPLISKPHPILGSIPGLMPLLIGLANRIDQIGVNIANKAEKLNSFFSATVMPAALSAFTTLQSHLFPLMAQINAEAQLLQVQVALNLSLLNLKVLTAIGTVERRLEAESHVADKAPLKLPSLDIGDVEAGIGSLVKAAGGGGIGKAFQPFATGDSPAEGGGGILGGIGNAVKTGLKTAGSVGIGILGKVVGGVGHLIGEAGQKVGEFTRRVVDGVTRLKTKKLPHDGELTGPFFPQPKDKSGDSGHFDAEHRHSLSDDATRRMELKKGARVFVNGIDTTLEDHYAAAQRLANELGKPVVGIYNASGGKGNDLLQCAADKLFDRTDNPAIRTLTGVLNDQGHKPGKQPTQIYAHSQGSLIVSEALRQAGKGGANLQQYEVTTFGNAAWTYPKGPKYHHYVHDDDLVPALAGTSSRMSYMMNQTRIGRWLSEKILGKMSDAQKDTTVLHHGGSMIGPHGVNARKEDGSADKKEQMRDYIGHLKTFQSEEKATGKRTARQNAIKTSVGFAMARGLGQMVSDGVSNTYGKLDRAVRTTMPMLGGEFGSLLWSGMSRRMAAVGTGIYEAGVTYGSVVDSSYRGRTQVQRDGTGPDPDVDADAVKAKLDKAGSIGFSPDNSIRDRLGGMMGFDPSIAKIHVDPAAAGAARDLGAQAFTIGRDIYFSSGQYDPASTGGVALLAHELTHVAQQTSGMASVQRFTRQGGDSMEQEAQRMASLVSANVGNPSGLHVERFSKTYDSERGLTQQQITRLENISIMAIAQADGLLGERQGTIQDLNVNVSIDLNEMDDHAAATVWANAIVAAARSAALAEVGLPQSTIVQRTPFVSLLHIPATPPREETPAAGDDRQVVLNMTVMGERFATVPYAEALRALRNTYRYLRGQVQAGEESHHDFIDFRNEYWFTGGVSDLLSWQSMPDIHIWLTPAGHLEQAYAALVRRDVDAALRHLADAQRTLTACQQQISAYREGTVTGAGRAVTGLETIRTGSAVVVGTIATVVMAPAAAVAVGVGYGAAQTIAQQGTEVSLGLRDNIDWAGITFDAIIGLIVGRFLGNLTNGLAGRLLSNPQFQTLGRAALVRIVQDVVTGRGSSIVSRVARNIFDHARGSRDAMTMDQMIHAIIDELCDPRSYFFDLVSGMGGRAAERSRARATGGTVHATPETMDTPAGRRAQEVLDVPPPRRESSTPPPTDSPPPALPPAPVDVPAPTTHTPPTDTPPPVAPPVAGPPEAPAAPTTGHPPTAPEAPATPPREVPVADAPTPAEPAVAGHPEGAPPPTAHPEAPRSIVPDVPAHTVPEVPAGPRPPELPPSTARRRGESAAQRRRRVAEEHRVAEEARRTAEGEPAPQATEHPQEAPHPRVEEAMQAHAEAVNAGGEPAIAAAEQLIRQVRSFRTLRELAAQGRLNSAAVQAITQARARMQARIREAVIANHPELEFLAPGTTGFASDTDVTVRPRDYAQLRTPEQVARAVEASGRAVEEANALARELGAAPDETLDTNYYSYTGADSPLAGTASPNRATRDARTVSSLAEQHQSMSPEAWTEYREALMREAGPAREGAGEAQRQVERQTREELRRQLDQAEQMSNQLRDQREALARQEQAETPGMTPEGAQMRARERLAGVYRRRLLAALARSPVDHAEVSTLQSQIKMIEPGAYASSAGIADVPYYQQQVGPQSGDRRTPVLDSEGRPVSTTDPVTGESTPLDTSDGARRYMQLDPVGGVRNLADSAGSSLAQLEAHAGHAPSSTAGALDLIKNVFKYCGRIQHADEATQAGAHPDPTEFTAGMSRDEQPLGALDALSGGPVDTVAGIPRNYLLSMLRGVPIEQGAGGAHDGTTRTQTPEQARQQALDAIAQESRSRGHGDSLADMAARFADMRLHWARERVASLRVRATTREVTGMAPPPTTRRERSEEGQ